MVVHVTLQYNINIHGMVHYLLFTCYTTLYNMTSHVHIIVTVIMSTTLLDYFRFCSGGPCAKAPLPYVRSCKVRLASAPLNNQCPVQPPD